MENRKTEMNVADNIDFLTQRIAGVSLTTSSSPVIKKPFIYCDDKTTFEQFHDHIRSLKKNSTVYLDCEGRDLGRVTGKLGLIQVGLEKKVYLIDVVAYPECITTMKDILEDENIEKVMWDGRSDATELWCGHGIALRSVIDLQLIRVYVSQRGVRGPRGYMKLDGMARTFENSDRAVKLESGIDMRRFIQVSDEVKTKHKNDETECWISRPLDDVLLEYAAFDIMQLRGIYSLYRTYLLRYPNIKVESQRYVDMFRDERRIKNCWYVDHGVLPQEILERPQQTKATYDHLGTHNCGGCGRDLHQESFGVLFGMWRKGQLCYTCAEARRFRSNPPPVRLIGRRY